MPRPLRVVALVFAAAGLAAFAGCDVNEDADVERGRALFSANCARCHTLAAAGSTSQVGPDLDASFARAREDGMDNDTIEGVTQAQIANPRTVDEEDPDYQKTFMPADLVTGEDAEDVATYVASVAGTGAEPPDFSGEEIFLNQGCGGCHTLQAAGTSGTTGPNLDEVLPGQRDAAITKSIVDPGARLTPDFPDAMPSNFGDTIAGDDLEKLVAYLVQVAGRSGGGN